MDTVSSKLGVAIRYNPDAVRQPVTIRSTEPLSDDELWLQLNETLRGLQYTTINSEAPGSYEVVSLRDAAGSAYIERLGDQRGAGSPVAGFRSVLITASPLDPAAAVSLIQPLVTPSVGKVVALAGSGEILVSDLSSRISLIESTLERVRNSEGEIVVEAIRAPPGRAVEFASAVSQLVDRHRSAGGKPLRGDVVATADNTSVTVVAPVEELDAWLAFADQAWPATLESRQYFVSEFDSETLSTVFDEAIEAQGYSTDGIKVFANTYTGSVTVTAPEETHHMLLSLVEELEGLPAGARLGTDRIPVRHRVAADLADQLSGLLDSNTEIVSGTSTVPQSGEVLDTAAVSGRSAELGSGPSITIDELTNSLLITGTPAQIASARSLADQLDTPISQVMLEVLLVSLTESETLDLGVELEKIEVGGGTLFRLSSLFGLGSDAAATALPGAGSGLTGVVLDPGEFSVLVRALETVNEGRSLSMPRMLVSNSQEAEFNSVTQQPILSTNASDVVATTSFGGFEDAGTTISVAPQILAGEQLNLDYSVTLSTFVGDSSDPALPPPRQQNQLSSSITIPDSYTVAVGGIDLDTFGEAESRVPLIGSVPWLGELFKNRSKSRSRTRFYVFIRASIYQDAIFEQLRYVSDSLAEEAGVPTGWPVIEPRVIR